MESGSLADWFVAGGTIFLGFIAVFQDKIRARLSSPKLDCEINLKNQTAIRLRHLWKEGLNLIHFSHIIIDLKYGIKEKLVQKR